MTAAETPSAAGATDLGRAPLEEVLAALRVDVQTGLSDAEVEARLRQYGANEVSEQKVHPLREFLKKLWGPLRVDARAHHRDLVAPGEVR